MVPHEFLEDDVTCMVLKLSNASGELGYEAIELNTWLMRFVCVTKEMRVVVGDLTNWLSPTLNRLVYLDMLRTV